MVWYSTLNTLQRYIENIEEKSNWKKIAKTATMALAEVKDRLILLREATMNILLRPAAQAMYLLKGHIWRLQCGFAGTKCYSC